MCRIHFLGNIGLLGKEKATFVIYITTGMTCTAKFHVYFSKDEAL